MNITCQDCLAERRNVQYRNTRYCESCRLLRNLEFVGIRTATCGCGKEFAPIARRDPGCGECAFGPHKGTCVLCQSADEDLLRPSIAVCQRCARDPAKRRTLLSGLRRGQRDRRIANNWKEA